MPELAGLFTSYQVNVPQVDAAIDREKAKTHGVAINDIFDTLQVYLGSLYTNDFNRFGRTYQVNVQAEQQFRLDAEQIGQLKVRNNLGEMIPLATFLKVSDTSGPDRVMHYNGFITAEINGAAAPGYSSGQAEAAIEKLLKQELPNGMTYEWTDLTYQQILAGNTALFVFPLCVLLAFLVLAAQYESWSLPLAVILIVPMTLLSAITGVIISGGDNNIFTQIGQHLHPDRLDRAGGPGVQERHPHRRVRQGQTGRGPRPTGRGPGSLPPASAADPDDLHRLHHGRGAAGVLLRCRRRNAPCHGRGGVLGDDRGDRVRGDRVRPVPDAGVLQPDPPPGRPPSGWHRRACAHPGESCMSLLKPLTPSLLALALAACAVGPDYHAPDTAPARLDSAAAAQTLDRSRFESRWWKQFDDPTLDQLVQASLQGNRDLRVAFARLKAARAIREDADNDDLPVVTSRASSEIGKGQVPGQTDRRVNQERYDLGLDMAWELDLFGRIQRRIEASVAREDAALADLQQLQVSLIAELVDAYGQLRGAQLRETIALANLQTQQDSRRITVTLRDTGVGNELDVVRADARLAAVEASVPQLQAEQVRARNRIATLLGPRRAPARRRHRRCGRGHRRPVPPGQPQRLPGVHRRTRFADRRFGSQRLGTGPEPEYHLGGLRPGQRACATARRQGRRRGCPGQL